MIACVFYSALVVDNKNLGLEFPVSDLKPELELKHQNCARSGQKFRPLAAPAPQHCSFKLIGIIQRDGFG
jgi:hypothetical protein